MLSLLLYLPLSYVDRRVRYDIHLKLCAKHSEELRHLDIEEQR